MSEQYFVQVTNLGSDEETTSGPFDTEKAAIEFAEREGERLADELVSHLDESEYGTRFEWEEGIISVWQATPADSEDLVYEIPVMEGAIQSSEGKRSWIELTIDGHHYAPRKGLNSGS